MDRVSFRETSGSMKQYRNQEGSSTKTYRTIVDKNGFQTERLCVKGFPLFYYMNKGHR